MRRSAALLLLALAGGVRAQDAGRVTAPPAYGPPGGLRLELSAGRARLGVEVHDPFGAWLLGSAPGESDFVEAGAALRTTLDGLRRMVGAEGEPAPRPVPLDPGVVAACPAVRVVGPRVVSVPVLLRLPFSDALSGLLEPALDVGWTTSRLSLAKGGSASGDDASLPGLGFQLSAGLEMSLTDILGLSVKAGWRLLRAPAADRDAIAGALVAPLANAGGDADLGGAYGTLGAVLRI